MGLFVLQESDSKEDLIKAAIANLHLYLNEKERHNEELDYLFDFSISQINQAKNGGILIHNGKSICN